MAWKPTSVVGLAIELSVTLCGLQLATSASVLAQGQKEAQGLVANYEKPVNFVAPGPSFHAGSALKGKTIYAIVSGESADFVQQFMKGLTDGAQVLGANVNIQDSTYDSTKAAELIDKAVAGGAAVIVTQSVELQCRRGLARRSQKGQHSGGGGNLARCRGSAKRPEKDRGLRYRVVLLHLRRPADGPICSR